MDLRTGRTYESKAAARAAGVPESDLMQYDPQTFQPMREKPQSLKFKKSPFGSIKNPKEPQNA